MIDRLDTKSIFLSDSNRIIIREALEAHRNELTAKLYGDVPSNCSTEYFDIEIQEVDEILEQLGEN